jgi:hypothetical protein
MHFVSEKHSAPMFLLSSGEQDVCVSLSPCLFNVLKCLSGEAVAQEVEGVGW